MVLFALWHDKNNWLLNFDLLYVHEIFFQLSFKIQNLKNISWKQMDKSKNDTSEIISTPLCKLMITRIIWIFCFCLKQQQYLMGTKIYIIRYLCVKNHWEVFLYLVHHMSTTNFESTNFFTIFSCLFFLRVWIYQLRQKQTILYYNCLFF